MGKKCKWIFMIFIMILLLAGCSSGKKAPDNEGIQGTWYECSNGIMEVVIFYDDGTYMRTLEEYASDPEQDYIEYTFDAEKGLLMTEMNEFPAVAELSEDKLMYTYEEYEETHVLYRDREQAVTNDPAYRLSDTFTDTIMDEQGFCIEDGILYAYRGDAEEIVVPDTVDVIYMEAFSGDYNHGEKLKKVTIPGTVKEIQSRAFAFTNADVIMIEEGVETLGDYLFMDSYVDEVHFPASLTDIGKAILETEEGLDGTKIYVPEGSKVGEYLKEYPPYGDIEIIKK